MATVHIYISLPCDEDRLLKNKSIDADCISEDDFVKTIIQRCSQRPAEPAAIGNMTLFEFATWFTSDYVDSQDESADYDELECNPLWRTNYNEPPLVKRSRRLPRIILTSGYKMRQHEHAKCVTFTCLHDNPAQSIYCILCLNIPHRNPINEFLGGKQGLN